MAGDEEDYWMEQIEPIYQQLAKRSRWGLMFKTAELHALSRAVQRRLLRHALTEIRGNLRSIDMEHVEALLRISGSGHGHDRVIIPGVDAFRSFETLLLAEPGEFDREARHYRLELPLDVECELPFQAGFICVTHLHPRPRNCAKVEEEQGFSTEWADLDERAVAEAGGALAVRNWGPGDELQRPGHTGPTKVKSLFQEYKVLLWERRHWPVVVAGNEIAWVRRFGAAARFCAGDENRRLRLRFRPVPGVQT
ncbi:MAG: tRNA lysidine(34) synthetase TilS [Acidobacteriia bacterium]|nr:tRNA lysidine(34) synthetase TilS [Terriglobia bacterium]